MAKDRDDEPPKVRLVSKNADHDIKLMRAKQHAVSQLTRLSAIILRTIAGSPSAPPIMPAVLDLFVAQKSLLALNGEVLDSDDERGALRLDEAKFSPDRHYRHFQYAAGMEAIVRGALRLAAHQILKEREHFGGKYSTMEIERGSSLVMGSKQPPPRKRRRIVL